MSHRPILPGAAVGVLGSGQLGRMFAIAARRMGYRVHTFSPDADTPTGQVADLEVIIAGAGGAAHLPGMAAAYTILPVLGVPIESKTLKGMDSLLSIVQMPAGIPVATLAIGKAGATNAALLAISILANSRPELREKLRAFREKQTAKVLKDTLA